MPTSPLSAQQASNQTGIPKRTLLAAITRGDLRAHKLGGLTGAYVIEQADLDAYLREKAS